MPVLVTLNVGNMRETDATHPEDGCGCLRYFVYDVGMKSNTAGLGKIRRDFLVNVACHVGAVPLVLVLSCLWGARDFPPRIYYNDHYVIP